MSAFREALASAFLSLFSSVSAAFTLSATASLKRWSAAAASFHLPSAAASCACVASAFSAAAVSAERYGRGLATAAPLACAFVSGALRITFTSDVAVPAAWSFVSGALRTTFGAGAAGRGHDVAGDRDDLLVRAGAEHDGLEGDRPVDGGRVRPAGRGSRVVRQPDLRRTRRRGLRERRVDGRWRARRLHDRHGLLVVARVDHEGLARPEAEGDASRRPVAPTACRAVQRRAQPVARVLVDHRREVGERGRDHERVRCTLPRSRRRPVAPRSAYAARRSAGSEAAPSGSRALRPPSSAWSPSRPSRSTPCPSHHGGAGR